MFHIFQGAYQQLMRNPYQAKMHCQKPKAVKVVRIKRPRHQLTEQHALHKVLSVAASHQMPEPEVHAEDLPVPDAKELTQDLIAAENLLHVYDTALDDFSQVPDLLAALEINKKFPS